VAAFACRLVTSRETLNLPQEQVFEVEPLEPPGIVLR
jgi:hypothetical protein